MIIFCESGNVVQRGWRPYKQDISVNTDGSTPLIYRGNLTMYPMIAPSFSSKRTSAAQRRSA